MRSMYTLRICRKQTSGRRGQSVNHEISRPLSKVEQTLFGADSGCFFDSFTTLKR